MEPDVTIWGIIWEVTKGALDVFYKLGMVVIAIMNIIFAKKLRKQQTAKDEEKSNSDHKVMLLKTLILDYNLDTFYKSFSEIIEVTDQLKDHNADIKAIEPQVQEKFKNLNEGFVELIQGIDETLYNNLLTKSDDTRDLIVNNMKEYRLSEEKVYKEHVLDPIAEMKKECIKLLFEFK